MTDIFVSYKREDRSAASAVVADLEAEGFTVFYDERIRVGETWDAIIERELANSRSVVVLWSKSSVDSPWVRREARAASAHNALFPVLIEDCSPPLEFSDIQTAKLVGRTPGDRKHLEWRRLCNSVSTRLADVTLNEQGAANGRSIALLERRLHALDGQTSNLTETALKLARCLRNGSFLDATKNAGVILVLLGMILGGADSMKFYDRTWAIIYTLLGFIFICAVGINIGLTIYGCRTMSMLYKNNRKYKISRWINAGIKEIFQLGTFAIIGLFITACISVVPEVNLAELTDHARRNANWEANVAKQIFQTLTIIIGAVNCVIFMIAVTLPIRPVWARLIMYACARFFFDFLTKKEVNAYKVATRNEDSKEWGKYQKLVALEHLPDVLSSLNSVLAEVNIVASNIYDARNRLQSRRE